MPKPKKSLVDPCTGRVNLTQNDDYVVIKERKVELAGDALVGSEAIYSCTWDPSKLELPRTHGETCVKCKKDYPHAERALEFTCWSCRNGY